MRHHPSPAKPHGQCTTTHLGSISGTNDTFPLCSPWLINHATWLLVGFICIIEDPYTLVYIRVCPSLFDKYVINYIPLVLFLFRWALIGVCTLLPPVVVVVARINAVLEWKTVPF